MKQFQRFVSRCNVAIRAVRNARPLFARRSLLSRASHRAFRLFVLAVACAPWVAHATELDDIFACTSQAHAYIQALQDRHLIGDHAMHVEEDGLNVYWPTRGSGLTAFSYNVFAVLGYQQDDPFFKAGKGEPMDGQLYGVVVTADTPAVAKALVAAGSSAEYKHAGPFLTAVYCRVH
jgi:hypothetical protein